MEMGNFVPASTASSIVLLSLAFVLCAVIGLEQQRRLRSAGIRTHTLVGVGSALFTLVSMHGFTGALGTDVVLDPSRVAAQIVSGIGFLGAGVIFVRRNVVNGLTTAASIWVTAAVGMACGAGLPVLGICGAVCYALTIILLSPLGRLMRARASRTRGEFCVVRYKDGRGALRQVLMKSAELGFDAVLLGARTIERPGKADRIEARMRFVGRPSIEELVDQLTSIKPVVSVQMTSMESD